jgi:hypothetical protein
MTSDDDHFPAKSVRRKSPARSHPTRAVHRHRRHRHGIPLQQTDVPPPDALQLDGVHVVGRNTHHENTAQDPADGTVFLSSVVKRDFSEVNVSPVIDTHIPTNAGPSASDSLGVSVSVDLSLQDSSTTTSPSPWWSAPTETPSTYSPAKNDTIPLDLPVSVPTPTLPIPPQGVVPTISSLLDDSGAAVTSVTVWVDNTITEIGGSLTTSVPGLLSPFEFWTSNTAEWPTPTASAYQGDWSNEWTTESAQVTVPGPTIVQPATSLGQIIIGSSLAPEHTSWTWSPTWPENTPVTTPTEGPSVTLITTSNELPVGSAFGGSVGVTTLAGTTEQQTETSTPTSSEEVPPPEASTAEQTSSPPTSSSEIVESLPANLTSFLPTTTPPPFLNTTLSTILSTNGTFTSFPGNSTANVTATSQFNRTTLTTSTTSSLGFNWVPPTAINPTATGNSPSSTSTAGSSSTTAIVPLVPAIVGSLGAAAILAAVGVALLAARRRRTRPSPGLVEDDGPFITQGGFTVLSGQRLDTGLSGGTPVVYRGGAPLAMVETPITPAGGAGRGVGGGPSRFTEHL